MINPDTRPGTDVICIDDACGPYGASGLQKGALYTVAKIEPAITGGFGVILEEVSPRETYIPPWGPITVGFELKRFRYLDLPKSLTRLLIQAPVGFEVID
jgi:hypothetical protein